AGASPPNDDLAQAQSLPQRVQDYWFTNVLASAEEGEPQHGGAEASHSVWFSWRPNADKRGQVEACGDGFTAVVAVYTRGEDDELVPVAIEAGTTACPVRGHSEGFDAEGGVEYLIAVDGADGGTGNFLLQLSTPDGNDN